MTVARIAGGKRELTEVGLRVFERIEGRAEPQLVPVVVHGHPDRAAERSAQVERRGPDRGGDLRKGQWLDKAAAEQLTGGLRQHFRAPRFTASGDARAIGIRVVDHPVEQRKNRFFDVQRIRRRGVRDARKQLPLQQVGIGTGSRERETDRPPVTVGRRRITIGQCIPQHGVRHRVPVAAVAIGTDALPAIFLAESTPYLPK